MNEPIMAKKPKPPAYSKYQQWCDAGKPYWSGVALANNVTGFATLKRTLNTRESPYNGQKLDLFLREHMALVPAEKLQAEQAAAIAADEVATGTAKKKGRTGATTVAPPPTAAKPSVQLRTGATVVIDNAVSALGPNVPAAWSESKLVLPDFFELPDVLKKGRLESTERRRIASQLHDQLCEGIADQFLRRDVCGEIVQRMDAVSAHYDLERDWKLNGHAPNLPEDTRAKLEALDLYALKELITNRLAPRVSRWKRACKLRDGDHLVEAKLRLAEAESDKALAMDIWRIKDKAHKLAMAQRDAAIAAKPKKK